MADVTQQLEIILAAQDQASAKIDAVKTALTNLGNTRPAIDKVTEGTQLMKGAIRELEAQIAPLLVLEKAFEFLKDSVSAFGKEEQSVAQLNAVLKSTAGAAGITTDAALKLADSLEKTTTFSHQAVLSAESLMLTFTNVHKEVFPQATKAALDMSVALGRDLRDTTLQLGIALNDPIKGITRLHREGVNFSDSQKELIKTLVDTGQGLKAQQIIVAELGKEFGGSATAKLNTFGGAWEHLQNIAEAFEEKFGGKIAAVLQFVLGWVDKFVTYLSDTFDTLQAMWDSNANGIRDKTEAAISWILQNVIPIWQNFMAALKAGWDYIVAIWRQYGQYIMDIIKTAFEFVSGVVRDGFKIIAGIFAIMSDIMTGNWSKLWHDIGNTLESAWNGIVNVAEKGAKILVNIVNMGIEGMNKLGANIPKLNVDTSVLDQIKFKMADTSAATKSMADDMALNIGNALKSATLPSFGSAMPTSPIDPNQSGGGAGKGKAGIKTKVEEIKKAYETLEVDAKKSLQNLKETHDTKIDQLTTKLNDLANNYGDVATKGAEEIAKLQESNTKNLASIDESMSKTRDSIAQLNKAFEATRASDAMSVADLIVKQEQSIADEKGQILSKTTERERLALQDKINAEQSGLDKSKDFIAAHSTEIAEARRRASLTDIERAIEDYNTKRKLAEEEHTQKIGELNEELAIQQAKRDQDVLDYNTKLAQTKAATADKLEKIKTEFDAKTKERDTEQKLYEDKTRMINDLLQKAEDYRQEIAKNTHKVTVDLLNSEIAKYRELAQAIRDAASAKTSGSFGLYAGARASGGGVAGGSTYLVGERGAELFTPNVSGYITPNNQLGGTGGGTSIIITGNMLLDDRAAETIGDMVLNKLKYKSKI